MALFNVTMEAVTDMDPIALRKAQLLQDVIARADKTIATTGVQGAFFMLTLRIRSRPTLIAS